MEEFGRYLREERESRGVSLRAVYERTRIRTSYLEAMENGKFDRLPGKAYARAFLKLYAQAVGLDVNELLRRFDEAEHFGGREVAAASNDTGTPPSLSERATRRRRRRKRQTWTLLGVVAVIVIAIVVWKVVLPSDPGVPDDTGQIAADGSNGGPTPGTDLDGGNGVAGGPGGLDDDAGETTPDDGAADGVDDGTDGGASAGEGSEQGDDEGSLPVDQADDGDMDGDATPGSSAAEEGEEDPDTSGTSETPAVGEPSDDEVDDGAVDAKSDGAEDGTVAATPFRIDLAFRGLSWVEAWVDGERVLYQNVPEGTEVGWDVAESARFRFGVPSVVDVFVDGENVSDAQTMNREFTAESVAALRGQSV